MQQVGLIGFGEAGRTFAMAGAWGAGAVAFDRKTDDAADREEMLAAYAAAGVPGARFLEDALGGVDLVLSLVTADQALVAAEAAAGCIARGALYCDMNSVSPATKRAAAATIEAAGARYADVAVMAPVQPAALGVPLLVSGSCVADAIARLRGLGFGMLREAGEAVGRASSIKMIRSVMVKGMEALTAECVIAAQAAGVLDEVLASLDASEKAQPWAARADYNLDRMLVHGLRRAAEMEEVARTLETLAVEPLMTRGTIERQRTLGALGVPSPLPATLEAKIARVPTTLSKVPSP